MRRSEIISRTRRRALWIQYPRLEWWSRRRAPRSRLEAPRRAERRARRRPVPRADGSARRLDRRLGVRRRPHPARPAGARARADHRRRADRARLERSSGPGPHPGLARDRRPVDRDRGDDSPDDSVRWHSACRERDESASRGTGGAEVKAVRFVNPAGETRIGALGEDGTITDAGAAGPQGFVPTTLAWEALQDADGPTHSADQVKLLHPVVPGKLIGIGLNYRSHAEESQLDIPSVPVIFAKFG